MLTWANQSSQCMSEALSKITLRVVKAVESNRMITGSKTKNGRVRVWSVLTSASGGHCCHVTGAGDTGAEAGADKMPVGRLQAPVQSEQIESWEKGEKKKAISETEHDRVPQHRHHGMYASLSQHDSKELSYNTRSLPGTHTTAHYTHWCSSALAPCPLRHSAATLYTAQLGEKPGLGADTKNVKTPVPDGSVKQTAGWCRVPHDEMSQKAQGLSRHTRATQGTGKLLRKRWN